MSLATDRRVKILEHTVSELQSQLFEVRSRLDALEKNLIEGDDLDMDELKAQYEKKFGKAPHHLMKPDTIQRALRE